MSEEESQKRESEVWAMTTMTTTSRKVKRKALKKTKRQQSRRERAAIDRAEAESFLNDPDEQTRARLVEEEEAERSLRERIAFEESERAWLEAMDAKRKNEIIVEPSPVKVESTSDDDCEFVEEGPPEIIWQGNEIIFKKKTVRVPKKEKSDQFTEYKDGERPISNPLPPDSEAAFSEHKNPSVSGQDLVESVALQIPNFGTEQDKAHCPFHLKTGVCRFGQRCSRVHFYPDKACTLLIKNMYNGPGLAWEQDEGLEYTDEEVERSYEEFYDDVHTEFLKFGEIVNFKVCRNGSFHLRGNVYVHFKSLDSAVLAYQSANGRYFAGKQVSCEFVNVTRWKVAICGEYMKTRFKTCSRGTACNFIHCFRNPGGDYEWADNDKPPPRYWAKKMIALFGYSDESAHAQENWDQLNSSSKISTTNMDRYHSRRSRSKDPDSALLSSSSRCKDNEKYVRLRRDQLGREDTMHLKDTRSRRKRKSHHPDTGESLDDEREIRRGGYHDHERKSSRLNSRNEKNDFHESSSVGDWLARDGEKERGHSYTRRSSRSQKKSEYGDHESEDHEVDRDGKGKERAVDDSRKNRSRHSRREKNQGDQKYRNRGTDKDGEKKSLRAFKKSSNEVSDLSDGEPGNGYSREDISKKDSYGEDLRFENKSNDSSQYDERGRMYNLDSQHASDRWEPEQCSYERHPKSRRKDTSACSHSRYESDKSCD